MEVTAIAGVVVGFYEITAAAPMRAKTSPIALAKKMRDAANQLGDTADAIKVGQAIFAALEEDEPKWVEVRMDKRLAYRLER